MLSQPEIEVTSFADGEQLTFTAEVDVRPAIELPELTKLPVTVDDAEVTEADVDEQVKSLADRFGTLTSVERPVEAGDFVSIDLSAERRREADRRRHRDRPVVRGRQRGADRRARFGAARACRRGSRRSSTPRSVVALASATGRASVTVRSVRTKQLPTLDDDVRPGSERVRHPRRAARDLRSRLERVKRLEQGMQARDNVLEALLGKVEIPLPERTVEDEIRNRRESLEQQLAANGLDLDAYLASQDESLEAHEAHTKVDVERDLRAQFVLDAVVVKEELRSSRRPS